MNRINVHKGSCWRRCVVDVVVVVGISHRRSCRLKNKFSPSADL